MHVRYPVLPIHPRRDDFIVWLRWVSLESPPSPEQPPAQGIRVELQLNRNAVLGPTVIYRRDLEGTPLYLRANRQRVRQVLQNLGSSAEPGTRPPRLDIQLIIHGSIANAPYAALYIVRDSDAEAISSAVIEATPLLQVQPSVPGTQWQCAGQANLRVEVALEGTAGLTVLN